MITIQNARTILDATTEFILFSNADHAEIKKAILKKLECLQCLAEHDYDSSHWKQAYREYKEAVGA